MNFDWPHYVPVLKGKRAEFPALGEVKNKSRLTPLFEAVPSADPDEIPLRMSSAGIWPAQRSYFVDFHFFDDPDDGTTPAPATHSLLRCFAEVAKQKQTAIPVTGSGRSAGYQDAVRQIVKAQHNGLAIRLLADDFEDDGQLGDVLEVLLKLNSVKEDQVDILIDLGSVVGLAAGVVGRAIRDYTDALPRLTKWRSLTAISGAFPTGLAPLAGGAWNTAPRVDWAAWQGVVTGTRKPKRLPSYGDYTIAHPGLPPQGRATILAQIRYSTAPNFLIWKGRDVFKHPKGFKQFFDICKDLVNRPEYDGHKFSWGDAEIATRATGVGLPGNAETWRKIGTNHHIEKVLVQISSLPGI